MMEYILGIITGLLIAVFILGVLTFFRRVIEHKITQIEKQIDLKAPHPKGFIIMPTDEKELKRQAIIKKNEQQGRDTHISELL